MNDKNELISNANDEHLIRLSRLKRILIFICFFVIYLLNCLEEGIVSASSNQIKEELNINDKLFGLYGSIVHIGRITNIIFVFILLDLCNRKYLIFLALISKCSTYCIYLITTDYLIIMIFRLIQGFSQIFPEIYFQKWIAQFGPQNSIKIITIFINIPDLLGPVLGFNTALFLWDYKYSFILLAFSILLFDFILLFFPDKFFSPKIFFYETIKQKHDGRESVYSLFKVDEGKMKEKQKEKEVFLVSSTLWNLLLKPDFVTIVLAKNAFQFSIMGTYYWIGDYLQNVLGQDGKVVKASIYAFISLVGTLSGGLFGIIIDIYYCDYITTVPSLICFGFSILAGICGVLIPMTSDIMIFSTELFLFFFFGYCMIPILINITKVCADGELERDYIHFNNLTKAIFGDLPAPAIYGFINDIYKKTNPKMAMTCNLNFIWVNIILIVMNIYFRIRKTELIKEDVGTELKYVEMDKYDK